MNNDNHPINHTTNHTKVADQDEKLDIMEHINQDHQEEVLVIAQHYYPKLTINKAHLSDIFIEGMLIEADISSGKQNNTQMLFVKFELEGELEEQILYLAYMAMSKQGKDLSGNKKQYFEIINKQQLTSNMTRLVLQSQTPLPNNYAGYAYGMVLKTLNKKPDINTNNLSTSKPHGLLKKMTNQAFLWGLKKMSSKRRQKVVKNINKDLRLYTLRSAWQDTQADFVNTGYMDIFTHISDEGVSAGSQWVEDLSIGDVVFSRTAAADKHAHLATGQNLLIADETAYPALAGILDLWENETPPEIIIVSQKQAEQDYFDEKFDNPLPSGAKIHRIVAPVAEQQQAILDIIENIEQIDGVWGALENTCAKNIRHHLRNQRGLTGRTNHMKGYWRLS